MILTDRLILRPWEEDNPSSGRVMEKCGFEDCNIITICPNLEVGSDAEVRVIKNNKAGVSGNSI